MQFNHALELHVVECLTESFMYGSLLNEGIILWICQTRQVKGENLLGWFTY